MTNTNKQNRTHRLDIRVREEERVLMHECAKAQGMTLSAWLRNIAIKESRRNALRISHE